LKTTKQTVLFRAKKNKQKKVDYTTTHYAMHKKQTNPKNKYVGPKLFLYNTPRFVVPKTNLNI